MLMIHKLLVGEVDIASKVCIVGKVVSVRVKWVVER